MLLQVVSWFVPRKHRRTVFGFEPQNLVRVLVGTGGDTWRHHEACVEAKQSREELMFVRCTHLKVDYFAPGLSDSTKISKGLLGRCSRPINKIEPAPTSHLFSFHFLSLRL